MIPRNGEQRGESRDRTKRRGIFVLEFVTQDTSFQSYSMTSGAWSEKRRRL